MKVNLTNILLILATAGAAAGSFILSGKLKNEQETRLQAQTDNKMQTGVLKRTKSELTEEEGILRKAKADQTLATNELDTLRSTEAETKRNLATVEADLAKQQAEFDSLNKAMEEVKATLASLGGDVTIETLPDKLKEIETKKQANQAKLDELTTLVAAADKKVKGLRAEAARLADIKAKRDARIAKNSFESVITAVNPDWGFAIVGAGTNRGFSPQRTLIVERDGRVIGKLKPSAIETTQTIAEIDETSMAPGVMLQPGDRVLFTDPIGN